VKKSILVVAAVVIVIIIVAGVYLGYSGLLNQPSTNPTPTPTPEVPTQETVRDAAMAQIAANHTDIASLTENLTWTGGRQETGLVGSETYIYLAGNWNVTITNPVVLDPIYTITAVYTDTANAVTIEWTGTYQNNAITETSFNYIVP
jgi:archaellin